MLSVREALEDAGRAARIALKGAPALYVLALLKGILKGLPPLESIPHEDRQRIFGALAAARRALRSGADERLRMMAKDLGCPVAGRSVVGVEVWEIGALSLVLTLTLCMTMAELGVAVTLCFALILPRLVGKARMTLARVREALQQHYRDDLPDLRPEPPEAPPLPLEAPGATPKPMPKWTSPRAFPEAHKPE